MIDGKVKSVMAKVFNLREAEITEQSNNESIARWDSLGHMNLCLALEEVFGIELDGETVASMHSFDAVVRVVSEAMSRQ